MAISNYTELQTAVGNWLNRSDLTARIPEFIELAEAEIRRTIRTKHTTEIEVTTVVGDGDYTLPSDIQGIKDVYIKSPAASAGSLDSIGAGLLYNNRREFRADNQRPRLYALQDTTLLVSPLPDDIYTIGLEVERAFVELATTPTNYVLDDYPDVYLYGALVHSAPYLHEDERVQTWDSRFSRAIEQLKQDEIRNEHPQRLNMAPPRVIGATRDLSQWR
jgi:hypothetical protein